MFDASIINEHRIKSMVKIDTPNAEPIIVRDPSCTVFNIELVNKKNTNPIHPISVHAFWGRLGGS